jgi:putative phosphoesterase
MLRALNDWRPFCCLLGSLLNNNGAENNVFLVGVISDTHGLLRPEVAKALHGVDHILHAGDLDTPEILTALKELAPVSAIRGNMDYGRWASRLPPADMIELKGKTIYILHNLHQLDLDPEAATVDVVISGHTHRPSIQKKGAVLYLNPGSAGHRRYDYPISIGLLRINGNDLSAEIVVIE